MSMRIDDVVIRPTVAVKAPEMAGFASTMFEALREQIAAFEVGDLTGRLYPPCGCAPAV
jgi:hypothetical protein